MPLHSQIADKMTILQPPEASPHHVVLVADPQLVDPHTYPGRPWPLSSLTMAHTDLYLQKSFQLIQDTLLPDTVFFLGDLFDGGREWSTAIEGSLDIQKEDKKWRKYGELYWLREFYRFGRVFMEPWARSRTQPARRKERQRLIASLPGNHDLGFGGGIHLDIRKRFNAYFGEGNRVDMIGNHTFVSVDTVSLSAKGQSDPTSEKQGLDAYTRIHQIWEPVEQFIASAKAQKARAVDRELRLQSEGSEYEKLAHEILELDDPLAKKVHMKLDPVADVPSVLLSHVPLWRDPGTPCGPLRERWPPSNPKAGSDEVPIKDGRNAISNVYGYQYQNVLAEDISKMLVDQIGDIEYAFSGDDHDYCELVHHGYSGRNGGIREITVKTVSWAGGVREPGFLLVSLWNPLGVAKTATSGIKSGHGAAHGPAKNVTIKTHLCLLPNQLNIINNYLIVAAITFIILLIYAARTVGSEPSITTSNGSILPVAKIPTSPEAASTSNRSWGTSNGLAARSGRMRGASQSERGSGWDEVVLDDRPKHKRRDSSLPHAQWLPVRMHWGGVLRRSRRVLLRVATVVLLWYIWLVLT